MLAFRCNKKRAAERRLDDRKAPSGEEVATREGATRTTRPTHPDSKAAFFESTTNSTFSASSGKRAKDFTFKMLLVMLKHKHKPPKAAHGGKKSRTLLLERWKPPRAAKTVGWEKTQKLPLAA